MFKIRWAEDKPERLAELAAELVPSCVYSNQQNTILVYTSPVHVIAKPALVEFWAIHPDAERPLQAWYRTMESEVFADFNGLRATFASADYMDGLTIFNVGGNKYRLIAAIHYDRHKVFIRAVLTHAEYDRGNWKRRK